MFRPMGLLAGVIAVRCVPATKKPAKVKLNPRHVFFFLVLVPIKNRFLTAMSAPLLLLDFFDRLLLIRFELTT